MHLILSALLALAAAAPMAPREGCAAEESRSDAQGATALLIIDVQDFYFPGGAMPLVEPEQASANAGRLLAHFREHDLTVVHVGHQVSSGGGFHSDVAPRSGELVFMKSAVNAFHGTDLLDQLRARGIARLVICGMQTHMCVEAAVRAAHDLGFACVLVGDACATRDLAYGGAVVDATSVHTATLATLDRIYAEVVDTDAFLADAQ